MQDQNQQPSRAEMHGSVPLSGRYGPKQRTLRTPSDIRQRATRGNARRAATYGISWNGEHFRDRVVIIMSNPQRAWRETPRRDRTEESN